MQKAVQAQTTIRKTKPTEPGVFSRSSKPDMGQRYYILQIQKIPGQSLYHLGFVLAQNRRVAVSRNISTNLVTATFKTAFQEHGQPQNLIFHSDRGKQYMSKALTELFQKYGVKNPFLLRPGRWTMLCPKPFSRHSRERKPTERTIPLNNISAEV